MRTRAWLPPLAFGLLLLIAWWALTTSAVINPYFLPTPQSVLTRLIKGLSEGYLLSATVATMRAALLGCLVAGVLGIPLGYFIAKFRFFRRLVNPYLAASQAIPAVAVAPLLTIWIGYGMTSIVVLCTILVIFPVIVSTAVGVTHIDQEIIGAARLDGAWGVGLARRIELPLASPSILGGLRTGFTLSVTGAVVGEMVIGGPGLGLRLISAQHSGDTTGMFAAIVLLAVCAMAIYASIGFAERFADYSVTEKESQK